MCKFPAIETENLFQNPLMVRFIGISKIWRLIFSQSNIFRNFPKNFIHSENPQKLYFWTFRKYFDAYQGQGIKNLLTRILCWNLIKSLFGRCCKYSLYMYNLWRFLVAKVQEIIFRLGSISHALLNSIVSSLLLVNTRSNNKKYIIIIYFSSDSVIYQNYGNSF